MRMFSSLRSHANADKGKKYWALCDDFRRTFARAAKDANDRHFPIKFLGVWDTVSSVGQLWEPKSFPYATINPSIETIRHAMSLDERRAFFRQNRAVLAPGTSQSLLELWFPGVHFDIGGGYVESDGGLWRAPYMWIADEAKRYGLRFDTDSESKVLATTPASAEPWNDPQHESLNCCWRSCQPF